MLLTEPNRVGMISLVKSMPGIMPGHNMQAG